MAEAAAGPVGIYEHPQLIGPTTTSQSLDNARRLATVVLLRGLQAQAAGDPLRFVGGLRVSLALAASLRNKSVVAALHAGYMVERTTASAVQSWLTAMPAEPGLVRTAVRVWALTQAVALLQEADDRAPFDPRPNLLAERYLLREWLKGPSQWLPDRLTPSGGQRDAANPEADLVGFAWTVPWERERTRRLLGLGFEAGFPPPRARALVWDRPGAELLLARRPSPEELATDERNARVVRRATLLRAAVRLYQERAGSVPAALEDLVAAKVLPAVPLDPFDDRPFRYRVQARDDPFRGVGLPVTSGPSCFLIIIFN